MGGGVDIYLWPDGTWVLVEEFSPADYSHMSDDFELKTLTQDEYEELL